jgi:hypothetical protein
MSPTLSTSLDTWRRSRRISARKRAYLEGLHQIVVGASLQAYQLVLQRVPGGEHQHRSGLLGVATQLATDVQAIDAREHQVQYDHVVAVRHGQVQSADTILSKINGIATALQEFADHFRDLAIVFDQQD